MPICHDKSIVCFFSGKNLAVSAVRVCHITLPLRPAAMNSYHYSLESLHQPVAEKRFMTAIKR